MSSDGNTISTELERILDEINEKTSLANEGFLKTKLAEKFIQEKMRELGSLFPENSKIQLKYQRLREDKLPKYREESKLQFVSENSPLYRELFTIQDIIKELLKDCDPEFIFEHISKQNNFYFSKGDVFNARRMLIKILKSAKKNIVIIDPHIDDTIFDYFEMVDQSLDIKILTSSKIKKIIKQLFNNITTIRKNIQAKQSDDFHDRYIIIDNQEIWHLGTSINYVGNKAFQINKLVTENEINKIISDFNDWWQKGKVII